MNVRVKLFAAARELAVAEEVTVDVLEPTTAAAVRAALAARVPRLASLAATSLLAVNAEYAHDAVQIGAGDVVALIPPVSGG